MPTSHFGAIPCLCSIPLCSHIVGVLLTIVMTQGVAVVNLLQMQLVVVEVEVANHDGVVFMVNYSLLLHIAEGTKIYAML